MSIIYDALKKVEKKLYESGNLLEPVKTDNLARPKPRRPLIAGLVVVFILLSAALVYYYKPFLKATRPADTLAPQEPRQQAIKMPTASEIQTALKNTQIYQGEIDGVVGPQTISAIKKFQEKNGMKVTGLVDSQAWLVLAKYLPTQGTLRAPAENNLNATSPAANIPAPQTAPAPNLVLNGVFFSGDEGYALINNQITKKGDVIEGAVVVKIDLDEVELNLNGSTIKLTNIK